MQELRIRNLLKSKAYRDSIASCGLGETDFTKSRKRVIIAPSLTTAGEQQFTTTAQKETGVPLKPTHQLLAPVTEDPKFISYKKWIEQRKILRNDLDRIGKTMKKSDVQDEQKKLPENKVEKDVTPPASRVEGRVSKYPPALKIPPPVILAKIKGSLAKKRMRMYDLFLLADKDKDWKVNRKEFSEALKSIGIPFKDAEVEQLVAALDQNNDDCLEYKELIHTPELFISSQRANKYENVSELRADDSQGNQQAVDKNLPETEDKPNQLTRQSSSQSLLGLPDTTSSEFIGMMNQAKEKRLKRQKNKEKHRNKVKTTDEVRRQPCTMGGETGFMVDRFQEQRRKEYEKILELCHLHGVKLSRKMLERVLLHPEDRPFDVCLSSLISPSEHLLSERELYQKLALDNSTSPVKHSLGRRRRSSIYKYVYPPADLVTPRKERISLSSGSADISSKTDCWMTYEEYQQLTRHLDSRFEKSWKPSDENAYWPSYVSDKVRLYLDRPRIQVRSENSIFDIIHNRTIH